MAIDNALDKVEQLVRSEIERTPAEEVFDATVAVFLAQIPHGFGAALASIYGSLGRARVQQRVLELLELIKERTAQLESAKVDKSVFDTEEFQTYVLLAMEQLQTTHDREKLEMLANALSNTANKDFRGEQNKEAFIREIRELSPEDVRKLKSFLPQHKYPFEASEEFKWQNRRFETNPRGIDLLLCNRLTARGLLKKEQNPAPKPPNINSIRHIYQLEDAIERYTDQISKVNEQLFRLSELGRDFLSFVGEHKSDQKR
jgi:hypothetical protein